MTFTENNIYRTNGLPSNHNKPTVNEQSSKKISAPAILPTHTYQQAEAPKAIEDDYSTYEQLIQQNIDYEYFSLAEKDMVDSLVQIMLDVILTEEPTVKIGGETKNRNIVKSVYLKLNSEHIRHVVEQYQAQYHQIIHKAAYLRTMLYTVYQEIVPHYTNQVRADGAI